MTVLWRVRIVSSQYDCCSVPVGHNVYPMESQSAIRFSEVKFIFQKWHSSITKTLLHFGKVCSMYSECGKVPWNTTAFEALAFCCPAGASAIVHLILRSQAAIDNRIGQISVYLRSIMTHFFIMTCHISISLYMVISI